MKYLKKYKIFENKILDIEDIVLELKDDNFAVTIEKINEKSIKISICIPSGETELKEFKFSKIEDVVKRLIDYLYDYEFSFIFWGSDGKYIDKKLEDLYEDIIFFNMWLEKK